MKCNYSITDDMTPIKVYLYIINKVQRMKNMNRSLVPGKI